MALYGNTLLHSFIIKPSHFISFPKKSRTQIFNMVTETEQQVSTKRPTCSTCLKPTRICLCNRLKTPMLNNPVAITILQHSLEKKHPLNSAKIAAIGLKNVDIVTVNDVNFQARFFIRFSNETNEVDGVDNMFDEMPKRKSRDCDENDLNGTSFCRGEGKVLLGSQGKVVEFIVEKQGAISLFNSLSVPLSEKWGVTNFDELVASYVGEDRMGKGFVVERLLKKPVDGSDEYEENEEFTVAVPPGSVLLFPSEESVSVEDVHFEVKNLIVLDGTWAKAKRMYSENPWLKMLPHIRLDIDKLSLYSEVRHQPRAGYLSTIESIVYALKGVGEDFEGLDGLLDVFESMIGDQRQCKKERLSKESEISTSATRGFRYQL